MGFAVGGSPDDLSMPPILSEQIRCPWTRAELPASALDDLSEIRQAAEALEA